MSHAWFYSDAQRQQQGPVADSWLLNAYQRGEVRLDTLVWREGMPQWQPLSRVAAELGIVASSAPPSMPPPSVHAPRPPVVVAPAKSGNGCLIIGIVLLVGFVVVGGILAAIAIPAYNDYTTRARVSMAVMQGEAIKMQVATFYASNQRCPVNADEGFQPAADYASNEIASINVGSLDDGRCAVQILFNDLKVRGSAGSELLYAMDKNMDWTSTSTLPDKYLPAGLRQ